LDLQIPLAQAVLRSGQTVGIITADRRSLTRRHFDGIGISRMPAAIVGMEAAAEFSAVFLGDKSELDPGRCREEMVAAARRLLKAHPTVGAIILECTNMPPYAAAVQAETGLPVYDVTTLIRLAYQAALRRPYQTPFEA
jgi:Asp/Glu/hydantoin racemase